VYDGMKVWEFLDFFAVAYQIGRSQRKRVINDVLELLDLAHKRDDFVNGLSRGMKQRLCLAKTLVHDPPVLILDEPASGLDPRARVEVKALLKELRRMGKTILISSHILHELAELCTHVGIIERGKLLAAGTVEEITQALSPLRRVLIEVGRRAAEAQRLLAAEPGVVRVDSDGGQVRVEFTGERERIAGLLKVLLEADIPVLTVSDDRRDLESVFLQVTKGEVT
jgi:ABC-2 type transport system ATP-binding protein